MDIMKRPAVIGVLALIVGIVLGLIYAYQIDPIQFKDADPSFLRADFQQDYLRMTIDSFRVNGDQNLALNRYKLLGTYAAATFDEISRNPGQLDPGAILAFQQVLVQNNAFNSPVEVPAAGGGGGSGLVTVGIIGGGLLAVGLVAVAVFWLFRSNRRAPEDMTPAMQAAEHSRSIEKTDYSTSGEEPPVAQYVTTYVLGDDLFDDSFSIDAPSGEFLGECGVGISETIGVGDPKKVTAFEVWMFDKNDIQTVTKVLMSPHAFNDPGFRAKLEPKGELISVEPQKQVVLETQTLQMIATVSDMQYGQGALPDESYFERVTLELAIWAKK
jgi:hypothetical protein